MNLKALLWKIIIVVISFQLGCAGVLASSNEASYIAKWKDDVRAAFSITIDDGGEWDDRNIQALILEEYGVRGTFHIPTAHIETRAEMFLDIFNRGHELGSHSVSHSQLNGAEAGLIWTELSESKQYIEELTGLPCVSYCAPYGDLDPNVKSVAQQLYISARGVDFRLYGGINDPPETDIFELAVAPRPSPWPDGFWTDEEYISSLRQYIEDTLAVEGWGIEMWHNLTSDPNRLSTGPIVNETVWRTHLTELTSDYEQLVWVAPQGTVARYLLERQETTANTYQITEHIILVDLLFDGDKDIFNEPLTVVTRIPETWQNGPFTIIQDGTQLDYTIGVARIDPIEQIIISGDITPDVTGTYIKLPYNYNDEPAYKHENIEYYIWSTGKQHAYELYYLSPGLGWMHYNCWYSGGKASPIGTYYVDEPNAVGTPIATAIPGEEGEPCLLYDALPGEGWIIIVFDPGAIPNDLDGDADVDMLDLAILTRNWLVCVE